MFRKDVERTFGVLMSRGEIMLTAKAYSGSQAYEDSLIARQNDTGGAARRVCKPAVAHVRHNGRGRSFL